jgi:hypothetical protein
MLESSQAQLQVRTRSFRPSSVSELKPSMVPTNGTSSRLGSKVNVNGKTYLEPFGLILHTRDRTRIPLQCTMGNPPERDARESEDVSEGGGASREGERIARKGG